MRKIKKSLVLVLLVLLSLPSCKNDDNDIIKLIESKNLEERINGAYKAGESGEIKFVPYLMKNADDPATSTSLRFKGFSVYQQKMLALKKILKVEPPKIITWQPDSVVIKFYLKIAAKNKMK